MKKICFLLVLLTLLFCGCLPQDFFLPDTQITTDETTPDTTSPETTTPETTTSQEPPHEHVFKIEVFIEPTCTQPGLKRETCGCGEIVETHFDVLGTHDYQTSVVVKEPTCTEAGESHATCAVCGDIQTTILPATEIHIYGEAVVTQTPTCTEEGEKTATCITCDAIQKTAISATGIHLYKYPVRMRHFQSGKCGLITFRE